MLVHDGREPAQVALFQRLLTFVAELFDVVEVLDHSGVPLARAGILLGQNRRSRTGEAGEKQQQVVFQVVKGFRGDGERLDGDAALPLKFEREGIAVAVGFLVFRYCLSYTPVLLIFFPPASVAVVVTVRVFPSADMTTRPVMVTFPPFVAVNVNV